MPRLRIGKRIAEGVLDEIDVEPSGSLRLDGWTRDESAISRLEVLVNDAPAARRGWFRSYRADVAASLRVADVWLGFCATFAAQGTDAIRRVVIRAGGDVLASFKSQVTIQAPDYGHLLDTDRVLHRDDMYGVGPPSPAADALVLSLAQRLPPPILDFGCGSGALIRALRGRGLEARGIEIDRPDIAASLRDDIRPHVTLYDGRFPLPFAPGAFASVVCSEVLEHIPDFEGAVAEIARVARMALITVPDIAAVPALFPHHVVPWHLLEGTHVNFFTQASLQKVLAPHFASITFLRLGGFEVNGTRVYISIGALCGRP